MNHKRLEEIRLKIDALNAEWADCSRIVDENIRREQEIIAEKGALMEEEAALRSEDSR